MATAGNPYGLSRLNWPSGGVLREGVPVRYRVIRDHDRRYPIRLMCCALVVSAAGYYAWRSRPESLRSRQTRTLLSAIRVLHQESRETYGRPRIWDALVMWDIALASIASPGSCVEQGFEARP